MTVVLLLREWKIFRNKNCKIAKEMGGGTKVINFIFDKNPNKQKISATFHCCISLVGHKINQAVIGKVGGFIISNKTGDEFWI